MVRIDDQHGVVPQVVGVHGVQDLAQVVVAHGQHGRVLVDAVLHLLGRLPDLVVGRPVEHRALVAVRVQILVLLQAIKRLVGVKRLQLQKPVVLAVVVVDEFQTVLKGHGDRQVLLLLHVAAVHPVLPAPKSRFPVYVLRDGEVGQIGLPTVSLLASGPFVGIVLSVVIRSAFLPVMPVVADQMGVNPVVLKQLRHGVVVGLHGAPAAVQEVVPARVDFPPRRHAGHTAHVAVVKGHRPLRQTFKVGRLGPVAAVAGQHVPVQRIEHYHNCFHCLSPSRLVVQNLPDTRGSGHVAHCENDHKQRHRVRDHLQQLPRNRGGGDD